MVIGVDAARAFEPEPTGTERYARELLERLPRVAPGTTWVLFVRHPVEGPVPANVRIEVLRWPVPFLWHQLRLSLRLLRGGIDALFVPAHTVPLLHPVPTVTTVHDIGFEDAPELYDPHPGGGFVQRILAGLVIRVLSRGRFGGSELDYHRWSLRRALGCDAILAVSQATADRINDRFGQHPPIAVVPSGAPAVDRPSGGSPYPYPFVLVVGRCEVKKNLAGTLDAFRCFLDRHPDAPEHLVWIGRPGYGYAAVAESLPRSPHADRIHLLGYRPDAERNRALASAGAVLFLSRYEGFGFPLLEAMGSGAPVVASDIPALREVAGTAATLVNPNDPVAVSEHLHAVLRSESVRSSQIAAGHERYRAFDWDRTARQTLSVLESVVRSPGEPHALPPPR